jgi:hypothetical protein
MFRDAFNAGRQRRYLPGGGGGFVHLPFTVVPGTQSPAVATSTYEKTTKANANTVMIMRAGLIKSAPD